MDETEKTKTRINNLFKFVVVAHKFINPTSTEGSPNYSITGLVEQIDQDGDSIESSVPKQVPVLHHLRYMLQKLNKDKTSDYLESCELLCNSIYSLYAKDKNTIDKINKLKNTTLMPGFECVYENGLFQMPEKDDENIPPTFTNNVSLSKATPAASRSAQAAGGGQRRDDANR